VWLVEWRVKISIRLFGQKNKRPHLPLSPAAAASSSSWTAADVSLSLGLIQLRPLSSQFELATIQALYFSFCIYYLVEFHLEFVHFKRQEAHALSAKDRNQMSLVPLCVYAMRMSVTLADQDTT